MASKKNMKGKIVQLYEALFSSKEPSEILAGKPDYWDEFFLLKPNKSSLDSMVKDALKKDQLVKTQQVINLLFSQCTVALKEENNIRIANALLTLCCLSRMVLYKKKKASYNAVDILIGNQDLELKFEILLTRLIELILSESPNGLKALVLEFLLILITPNASFADNPLLPCLMSDHLFDALIALFSTSQTRQALGYQSVLLLTLLVNYRNKKIVNPFVVKLSIIHKEVALNGYAQVITQTLHDYNKQYDEKIEEPKNAGLFSSITSLVGSMFIADDDNGLVKQPQQFIRPSNSVLLAFYEAIHLNRNFITLLTNSPAESYDEPQPAPSAAEGDVKIQTPISVGALLPPPNLLVTFIEFCSIAMLNTRDEPTARTSKLCFIILTCITEDHGANAIIHDPNLAFRVQLRRTPMRHRKILDEKEKPSRPLFCAVLDLMVEFILSNLRKTLPIELHTMALGVTHHLWSALITLLKFLINNEGDLLKKMNIFALASTVCNQFNLFITFGDTFLPSEHAYDQLYYEIIRMHLVFENLYSLALRHSSIPDAQYKDSAARTVSALANIKAIINHFSPKIDAWTTRNQIESIETDHVLEIVRDNYDSLTLKLQEGLDSYELYNADMPKESEFLKDILDTVVSEFREQSSMMERDVAGEHAALINEIMNSNQQVV